MNFTYSYETTMRDLAIVNRYNGIEDVNISSHTHPYTVSLVYQIDSENSDIPLFSNPARILKWCNQNEPFVVVTPLVIDAGHSETRSNAESLLKSIVTRGYRGTLVKGALKNGECYYGTSGLLLDKDFSPLLYVTAKYSFYSNTSRLNERDIIIHIHPKVFTDDSSTMNKMLLKKGIAFYLSHSLRRNNDYPKVVIDDGKNFFKEIVVPKLKDLSKEEFNKTLKDNIGDVLNQIIDDYTGIS